MRKNRVNFAFNKRNKNRMRNLEEHIVVANWNYSVMRRVELRNLKQHIVVANWNYGKAVQHNKTTS